MAISIKNKDYNLIEENKPTFNGRSLVSKTRQKVLPFIAITAETTIYRCRLYSYHA